MAWRAHHFYVVFRSPSDSSMQYERWPLTAGTTFASFLGLKHYYNHYTNVAVLGWPAAGLAKAVEQVSVSFPW
jgi:hypothetical protein